MNYKGSIWECSCGNVQYNEEVPEECEKCGEIDRFEKISPDALNEDNEEEIDLE